MRGGALPGFRDFYPDEFARRAHLFRAWRDVCRRHAFVEYDGPPLEPLELYTKKSGEEITAQLYTFTDKGGREVALRPEMTPTFARMIAAKAQSLRKPIRWFSIPQLFRYERQQKGRLREHFQLNVDIVGEASEVADAELLCVAIECMRELGLTEGDVRARVSDRRLLNALLREVGARDAQLPAVHAVLDKVGRQPRAKSLEKLLEAGLARDATRRVLALADARDAASLRGEFGKSESVAPLLDALERYLAHLQALGVREWVDLDLSVVRGLAYYTGVVFELFDRKGALRAICGGGRYDTLLMDLGGVDLPAVGFGMGDVVLGELLSERGLTAPSPGSAAHLYLVGGAGAMEHGLDGALRLVASLRRSGFSVDYAMSGDRYLTQALRNQMDSAKKSGARAAVGFATRSEVEVVSLAGKISDAGRQLFPAAALLSRDAATIARLTETLRSSPFALRQQRNDDDRNVVIAV